MSDLATFSYEDQEVRGLIIDDEPWFVSADLLALLDLTRSSVALLDSDERGVHTVHTPGGVQDMSVVSEGGMWSLILRSRKDEAKRIKRWVTHDVLPQIRRTGSYAPRELSRLELIEIAHAAETERIEALGRAEAAETRALELEAPAAAWNDIASASGDWSVGDAAKMLCRAGIATGQNRLFVSLDALGWTFRRSSSGHRHAKQSAVEMGLVSERARPPRYDQTTGERHQVAPQIRVTAKGLERLRTEFSLGIPAAKRGAS